VFFWLKTGRHVFLPFLRLCRSVFFFMFLFFFMLVVFVIYLDLDLQWPWIFNLNVNALIKNEVNVQSAMCNVFNVVRVHGSMCMVHGPCPCPCVFPVVYICC
jgi:hypothetical protein